MTNYSSLSLSLPLFLSLFLSLSLSLCLSQSCKSAFFLFQSDQVAPTILSKYLSIYLSIYLSKPVYI